MKSISGMSLLLVGLFLNAANVQAAGASSEQEWRIKAEIQQLVHESAIARDKLNAVAYANSFSKDGIFVVPGKVITGRDAILARSEAEPKNVAHMHLITTNQVTIVDDNNATGTVYTTAYAAPIDKSHAKGTPAQVKGPAAIGIFHDEYKLTDEGWKISKREYEWVFSPTDG